VGLVRKGRAPQQTQNHSQPKFRTCPLITNEVKAADEGGRGRGRGFYGGKLVKDLSGNECCTTIGKPNVTKNPQKQPSAKNTGTGSRIHDADLAFGRGKPLTTSNVAGLTTIRFSAKAQRYEELQQRMPVGTVPSEITLLALVFVKTNSDLASFVGREKVKENKSKQTSRQGKLASLHLVPRQTLSVNSDHLVSASVGAGGSAWVGEHDRERPREDIVES
jgi:hypothetical protein